LKPDIQFSSTFILIYVAAWFTGFVSIFAPSGIGVRESIMILLLSLSISTTEAAAIAVFARVWTTSVELLMTLMSVFVNDTSSTTEPVDSNE